MDPVSIRLKRMRESTVPRLSIRRIAEIMDMAPSSYAFYEDPKKYKKRYLPMEFAKALTEPLTAFGVDYWDVLALAGFEEGAIAEINGDGNVAPRPAASAAQIIPMSVMLPSEAALARMFEGLLRPLDLTGPKDELARILAQRLPNSLARLATVLPPEATVPASARGAEPLPPATDHLASQQESRT